ncbi:MAG TPA: hypothetical protein VMM38_12865 [Aridibacter sp.]|nr:hypothetical protein [Aridibacter sp.]
MRKSRFTENEILKEVENQRKVAEVFCSATKSVQRQAGKGAGE